MKKVGIVYNDIFVEHRTNGRYAGHPECRERLETTVSKLKEHEMLGDDANEHFIHLDPRMADEEQIKWAHDPILIEQVQRAVKKAKGNSRVHLDGDTPVSSQSYDAALYAAGGNFSAIDAIFNGKINRAFILCRPPGHHANKTRARGFCLFNNVVLATHYLAKEKGLKKIAIVDFDVHAGNGTEDLLWNGIPGSDAEVLMISSHQDPRSFYPFECFPHDIGADKEEGKIINITLAPDSSDDSMNYAFKNLTLPALEEFKPEFILVSAGFDAHKSDPIGGLSLTVQQYGEMIKKLNKVSEKYAKGRLMATLEGGYNLSALSKSIANVVHTMSDDRNVEMEDEYDEDSRVFEYTMHKVVPGIHEILAPYWGCFESD